LVFTNKIYYHILQPLQTTLDKILKKLQDLAIKLQIEPLLTVEHAAKVNTIIKVLQDFNKSYTNYFEIEFSKNESFQKIVASKPHVFEAIKEDLELLAVDVNFGSFEISISPNLASRQITLFNDEVEHWKKEKYLDYKENIVYADYDSSGYINELTKKYTDDERHKIFQPLFSSVGDGKNYRLNLKNNKGNVQKVLYLPKKELLPIYVAKPEKRLSISDEKTIMAFMKIKKEDGEVNLKKSAIKKVYYLEELEHDTYPYKPDIIKIDDTVILLKEKLGCEVEFTDDLYYIKYSPLDICVWGNTREEAEEAFNFSFNTLYEDFAKEHDKNLTVKAKDLKIKINLLIDKVLNETPKTH
jgi:hypothetical protein